MRPSEHVLVPKHEIAGEEERKLILEKYGIRPEQLPYILASDPAVKEIGAQPGDIVKITRRSRTAGTAVYYRYVVEG
ncbi:MAG: DNA-directed RNA polymerase subunit H [Conexivisphaera sp.]